MDTRDVKTNASKLNSELGRHQRVLDAYLAHAGDSPLPPPALDAKLMALAASSVKVTTKAVQHADTTVTGTDLGAKSLIKTHVRSRRRHWPFALAASVATIGFAAILARNGLLETPGYREPSYQAGSYDAKSATEQAQVDATAVAAAEVASDAAVAASETPAMEKPTAVLQEEMIAQSREQIAAAPLAKRSEDKSTGNRSSDAEFERAAEPALGRVAAAPIDSGASAAEGVPELAYDRAVGGGDADTVEIAPAPTAVMTELAAAPEPIIDASPAPAAPAPPAEVLPPDVQAADARGRHDDKPAIAARGPAAAGAAKSATTLDAAKEADRDSLALPAIPEQRPQPAAQPLETMPAAPSTPHDAPLELKKDEFALAGNAANPHEKTYAAIRALRDGGEMQQAKAMLARFKKAYPKVVLPDDLNAFAKVK